MSDYNTSYDCATSAMEIPEFERILDDLGNLVNRLRSVRETSATISDALIGVQDTVELRDGPEKVPEPPNYFVIRCFNSLSDLREEVDRLESVNTRLLHRIKIE